MRKSFAFVGAVMMIAALMLYVCRGIIVDVRPEPFVSGGIVGMEISRTADPPLTAALQKMMDDAQWLACVPVISLEKMARAQAGTGAKTLKGADVAAVLGAKKIASMADIQRLPYSPEFKAALNKYVDYSLVSMTDILKQFTNADDFVDLDRVAKALSETRKGYCLLGVNFGTAGNFLVGTAP